MSGRNACHHSVAQKVSIGVQLLYLVVCHTLTLPIVNTNKRCIDSIRYINVKHYLIPLGVLVTVSFPLVSYQPYLSEIPSKLTPHRLVLAFPLFCG